MVWAIYSEASYLKGTVINVARTLRLLRKSKVAVVDNKILSGAKNKFLEIDLKVCFSQIKAWFILQREDFPPRYGASVPVILVSLALIKAWFISQQEVFPPRSGASVAVIPVIPVSVALIKVSFNFQNPHVTKFRVGVSEFRLDGILLWRCAFE